MTAKAEGEPRTRHCGVQGCGQIGRNRKFTSPPTHQSTTIRPRSFRCSARIMAAEAQAEGPALPPPPLPHGGSSASPEKRGFPIPGDDGAAAAAEEEEERRLPAPKRRRACVAALDSVPSSVAEEAEDSPGSGCGGDGDGDGASFSFQHARGGFVALETTPKFGSFNPPGEAELAAVDLNPAEHEADAESSPEEAGDEVPAASAPGVEGKDESSQLLGDEVDGQVQA